MYPFGEIVVVMFTWRKRGDNQKKKFITSNSVEAFIPFNEEHRGLLKLQVPLGRI